MKTEAEVRVTHLRAQHRGSPATAAGRTEARHYPLVPLARTPPCGRTDLGLLASRPWDHHLLLFELLGLQCPGLSAPGRSCPNLALLRQAVRRPAPPSSRCSSVTQQQSWGSLRSWWRYTPAGWGCQPQSRQGSPRQLLLAVPGSGQAVMAGPAQSSACCHTRGPVCWRGAVRVQCTLALRGSAERRP